MKRGGPLRVDPDKMRNWKKRSKRLKPMSDKRRADLPRRRAETAAVFARDGHRCALLGFTRCMGPLTPHHVKKASGGGAHERDNLVTLCAHHNTMVEDEPTLAASLGLVQR